MTDMTDQTEAMRDAFEAEFSALDLRKYVDVSRNYIDPATQCTWICWQRAWQAAQPAWQPIADARNAALEEAAILMEWENPIYGEEVAEYIDGWPRNEPFNTPRKSALARANAIRALKTSANPAKDGE